MRVFLEQNRSWQKAAQCLNVHKQTLVYRVRRIEEITGRSLDSTEDVAVLWIALRAGEIAGLG
ncbi:carbohydrate diacid transcriptional activator CdaR [compost metagenome]